VNVGAGTNTAGCLNKPKEIDMTFKQKQFLLSIPSKNAFRVIQAISMLSTFDHAVGFLANNEANTINVHELDDTFGSVGTPWYTVTTSSRSMGGTHEI
jgi:hypothetical protein